LPEDVVCIPVLHNDNEEIYQVGCGNPGAWNVAVAVSHKVATTARNREPDRPILEITSGVELPEPSQWAGRKKWSLPLELIFIGRLDHGQKGVLWLPEIYRACLDRGIECRLTVVGDGPDAGRVEQKLSDRGVLDRTRRLKGLTTGQVYQLLLNSHVLLMPSFYEGLPIALLESLACGCVPVASRLPGITDAAISESETGLLAPVADVAGFTEAIQRLSRDESLWSRMSRAAHADAQARFSIEAMGQAYLQLIGEGLAGKYPLPRPRASQRAIDLSVFSWRDFIPDSLRRYGRRGRAWWRAEATWASTFKA
jgi:glycosyltransferase involved in cell wall biosynthesis